MLSYAEALCKKGDIVSATVFFQAFHAYSDLFVCHDIGIHVICRVGGQAVGRVFHGTAEKMDIQKFIAVNSVFLQVVSI